MAGVRGRLGFEYSSDSYAQARVVSGGDTDANARSLARGGRARDSAAHASLLGNRRLTRACRRSCLLCGAQTLRLGP